MRAQAEHAYKSTQMKADIGEHTEETTHMKAHRAKRTWTGDKSHFVLKFKGKMPDAKPKRAILCGNLRKMPDPNFRTPVLCTPAQSKRTWTFHRSHFLR